jgi:hypothetical protein
MLGGLLAVGASTLLIGCEPRFKLPAALATPTASRKPPPLADRKPPTAPAALLGVDFGRVLRLEGVTIDEETVRAGGYFRLWFHWLSIGTSQEDFRSIGQLVGAQGRVVAKEDDQIGGRRRVLSRWKAGERHVDEMRVRIAPSAPLGELGLTVGVLRPDNQTQVPITGAPADVATWNEDLILVGTIEIVAG